MTSQDPGEPDVGLGTPAVLALGMGVTLLVPQLTQWVSHTHRSGLAGTCLDTNGWAAVVAFVVAALNWRYRRAIRFNGVYVAGVVVISTAVNVVTHDASVGALFYLALPSLFAAYHLGRGAAAVGTALSILGIATSTVAGHDPKPLADTVYAAASLSTITVAVLSMRRQHDVATTQLAYRMQTDPLTGLRTRPTLQTQAEAALARGLVALVLIDLDGLKTTNDTWGHPGGDAVLRAVAGVLTDHSRGRDVVCRLGGDEFAVLMPGCPVGVAFTRAGRLVEAIRRTSVILPTGSRLDLSVSVGVAGQGADGPYPFTDLYAAADRSLYDAKRGGRDQVGTPVLLGVPDLVTSAPA